MRDLATLARFVPALEAPGFAAGTWHEEEGVFPYANLGEAASALVQAAYADGWVLPGFDWPEWIGTAEAQALRDAPSTAGAEDLARLLTAVIRQDRFAEGALLDAFESGLMLAIIRRAAALAAT